MILGFKILAGFLIGAIPFAKLAMLGTGIDITKTGSKNPGFNNVLRVTKNWRRAGVALIGDVSKGYAALLLLSRGEISASAMWFIGKQPGLLAYVMFTIVLVRHTPNLREIMASKHE